MGHSSREAEKVVATTRPEKLLLLFWCVLALLPSHPLETSSRSPPASLGGGVLTQERLNFSFQLLWCGRANGLDHATAPLSPHIISVPHVKIWKDAQMLLSTSVLLSTGKVKVLNWEHGENKGAVGPGRTSQTRVVGCCGCRRKDLFQLAPLQSDSTCSTSLHSARRPCLFPVL